MENIIIQIVLMIGLITLIICSFLFVIGAFITFFHLLDLFTRKIRVYAIIRFKISNMNHNEKRMAADLWKSLYNGDKNKIDKYFKKD